MYEIFLMTVRRVLQLLSAVPIVAKFLGVELTGKLQEHETAALVASILVQVGLYLWSAWTKMREKARLQTASDAPRTTVEAVKEKVAAQPIVETVKQGLKPA